MSDTPETVTISHTEYMRLKRKGRLLSALREAGVDNWEGYSVAMSSIPEDGEGDE